MRVALPPDSSMPRIRPDCRKSRGPPPGPFPRGRWRGPEKLALPSKSLDTKRKIVLLFSRGVKLASNRRRPRPWTRAAPGIRDARCAPQLAPERVDLVSPRPGRGPCRPPGKRGRRRRAARQGLEAVGSEAETPEPVEGQEDGGGIAAAASQASRHGDPLGDPDLRARPDLGEALAAPGPPAPARLPSPRGRRVVAVHGDAPRPLARKTMSSWRSMRLEQRAQLVIAVLARDRAPRGRG